MGLTMLKGIEEGIEKIQHITTDIPPELEAKLKDLKEHLVLPKGNYFMPYNIVIGQEGRLEIMPGTKLFFGEKNGILAYWPLIAIATEEEQITFTGDKEKGWGNISFIGRFSNDSVLRYCNINHGDGREEIPKKGEFEAYFSTLSRGGGILFHKSDATVEKCRITENKADWGGGAYIEDSTPKLRDNLITKNEARWSMGGVEWSISRFSTPEQYKIKQDNIIDIIKSNKVRENKIDLENNIDGSGTYLVQNQTS